MKRLIIFLFGIFSISVFAQKKDYLITIKTDRGDIKLILFDETPLHKANFLRLVKSKFYEGLLFHRVIDDFMMQGGDPNSRNADKNVRLGGGGTDAVKIPYEFTSAHVHTKGALAAARGDNPQKASNSSQFYIVKGKKYEDQELNEVEKSNGMKYTNQQRLDFLTAGGYPKLDNRYTVFGQVISNLSLVDSLCTVATNEYDRPVFDIKFSITANKMRKRKIEKKYKYTF